MSLSVAPSSQEEYAHPSMNMHCPDDVCKNIENSEAVFSQKHGYKRQKGRKRAKLRQLFHKHDKEQNPNTANSDFDSPKPTNQRSLNYNDEDVENPSLNGGNRCIGRRRDHIRKTIWDFFGRETYPSDNNYTPRIDRQNVLEQFTKQESKATAELCNFAPSQDVLATNYMSFSSHKDISEPKVSESGNTGSESSPPLFSAQYTSNFSKNSSIDNSPFSHEHASGVSQNTSMNSRDVEKPVPEKTDNKCSTRELAFCSSKITNKDKECIKKINNFLAEQKLPFVFDQNMEFVKDHLATAENVNRKKVAFVAKEFSTPTSTLNFEQRQFLTAPKKSTPSKTVSALQADMTVKFAKNKKFSLENDLFFKDCISQDNLSNLNDTKLKFEHNENQTFKRFTKMKSHTRFKEECLKDFDIEDLEEGHDDLNKTFEARNLKKKSKFYEGKALVSNPELLKNCEDKGNMTCKGLKKAGKYMDCAELFNIDKVSQSNQEEIEKEKKPDNQEKCTINMQRLKMEDIEEE